MKHRSRNVSDLIMNIQYYLFLGFIALVIIPLAVIISVLYAPLLIMHHRKTLGDALRHYAYAGDIVNVRRLLSHGVDPKKANALGCARMRVEQGHDNQEVIALLESVGAKDKRERKPGQR